MRQLRRKAISPIIATLLLILIAIAAGVIVYAYVVGFIGNSTTNSGGATNTLSVDQLNLAASAQKFPVSVYIRNLGPGTETFNTGFVLKGTSLSTQIVPAISVAASAGTTTISAVSLTGRGNGSLGVTMTCAAVTTVILSGFGATRTFSCGTSQTSTSLNTPSVGASFSNGTGATFGTTLGTGVVITTTPIIVGVPVTTGAYFTIGNSQVGQLTLASAAGASSVAANPMTFSGQTYTVQVSGTDGATAAASAKAS